MHIGVIGMGRMGRNHARVLNELGVLVAVCDIEPTTLIGYPSVTWTQTGNYTSFRYSDYHEMLREKQLDAVVKAGQGVADVIRTSNTVVTITLDAFATYDITAAETITATIPGSALTGGVPIVATPTFRVTLAGAEGWLSGWAKRVKLTIDNTDIDVAVSNFPILVYLSTSSGRNSDDVSFIFDELTSDDNRKKIAVTTDDGETECYVEIEKWDDANEKAWLWVKVPSVASGADTDLYLYYDSSHADNDTYIGDPSDAVVHNVWDANFKFVSHMRDDPDTSHIRDSTVNALDGTKKGAGEPAITTGGMINDAQHFDNVDDYIDLGTSLSPVENFTVEIWGKIDALATDKQLVSKGYDGTNTQWEIKTTAADGKVSFRCWTGSAQGIESTNKLVADEWTYLVGIYSTTTWYLHWNGAPHVNSVDTGPIATAQKLEIGAVDADGTPSQFWDGVLCELRISDMVRTDAWIKATYETGRDDLLDFGEEETSTSIKTICGVAIAAIKTVSGVAIADVKSVLGVSNVD